MYPLLIFGIVVLFCLGLVYLGRSFERIVKSQQREYGKQMTELVDRNIFLSQARAYPASLPQREEPEVTEVVDPDWKEL